MKPIEQNKKLKTKNEKYRNASHDDHKKWDPDEPCKHDSFADKRCFLHIYVPKICVLFFIIIAHKRSSFLIFNFLFLVL